MSGVGLVDRIEKKFAVMSSEKAESRFLSLVGLTNETEASAPSTPGKVYHLWLNQLFECWASDCTLSAVRGERDCLTGAITRETSDRSLNCRLMLRARRSPNNALCAANAECLSRGIPGLSTAAYAHLAFSSP